jgi:hypothetical protein
VFDGNTTRETYESALEAESDGELHTHFGLDSGPLSGEWADGLTPKALAESLGLDYESLTDYEGSELSEVYETAFYDAYYDEILRIARYQTED